MRVIGYGVCGKEANRYLRETLEEFKRLCDETVICLNNATQAEKDMINEYGFYWYEDNREWGKNQHIIKQDLLDKYVSELKPDWCICLDMDETFADFKREDIAEMEEYADALYVFIVNLWDEGWSKEWSFWNIRVWKWGYNTTIRRQPLHCGLAPEWAYHYGVYSPYVLIHNGLKERKDRQKKIERYEKYDPKAQYKDKAFYDALKEDKSDPFNKEEVVSLIKNEWLTKNKPIKKKTFMTNKPSEKIVYMRRISDGALLDIPERHVAQALKNGMVLIESREEKVEEKVEEPLVCDCGFTAKTAFGLTVHKRKHV